jgi:hypothetical protein
MTNPDAAPPDAQAVLIASALTPMQVMAEAVIGYHAKLREGGIGEESAGRMAEAYHEALMGMLDKGITDQMNKARSQFRRGR